MSFASKGYVDGKVRAVDSKYAELITSGTHRQGLWNAATNTPILSPNSGTNGFWYDVSVEGDWDGRHWRVGDKIIFNSATNKWDQIPTGVEKDDQPMLIGFLNENSSFPETRPSGKPLLIGDYLKVDSAAVLPFEIDDGTGTKILFDSYMDEAEWNGSRFQEKSYKAGMTNEIGVKNPEKESLSEEAVYQNQVNKEFKDRLKNIGEFVNVGNSFENVEKNDKFLYYLEEDYEPQEWPGLKFTSNQDNSTLGYRNYSSFLDIDIYYSTDGKNWTSWGGSSITINNGESIYIWNKTNTLNKKKGGSIYFLKFTMSGSISASGNVNSMINFNELTSYCYFSLFSGCISLTTAPDLPATQLAEGCYDSMFAECTSLTQAPDLPATQLANGCYNSMFAGCNSLTTAPDLPATQLANGCYTYMFSSCTALNSIKLHYVGDFDVNYFDYWVNGVSSSGTLYYNGQDTTRGSSAIPEGWTVEQFSQNGGE